MVFANHLLMVFNKMVCYVSMRRYKDNAIIFRTLRSFQRKMAPKSKEDTDLENSVNS